MKLNPKASSLDSASIARHKGLGNEIHETDGKSFREREREHGEIKGNASKNRVADKLATGLAPELGPKTSSN